MGRKITMALSEMIQKMRENAGFPEAKLAEKLYVTTHAAARSTLFSKSVCGCGAQSPTDTAYSFR